MRVRVAVGLRVKGLGARLSFNVLGLVLGFSVRVKGLGVVDLIGQAAVGGLGLGLALGVRVGVSGSCSGLVFVDVIGRVGG